MARERMAPPPQPPDPPDRRDGVKNKKGFSVKKMSKVRKARRPALCTTKSVDRSLSRSLSKSRTSEKDAQTITNLKLNNTMLAKVVNQLKQLLALKENEIMNYKNEIMSLNQENSILRTELEKHDTEESGYIATQKGVKVCLDAAIDSFVTFTTDFNKEMEKAYSELSRGLKAARLSRNSRSRSTGKALCEQSRDSAQFSKPTSPVKNLPQNKVSPMVAGHPITRPRVQLTRMSLPASHQSEEEANPEENEEQNQELEEEEEEQQQQHQRNLRFQEPNPEPPRRTPYDMTVILEEESYMEQSSPEPPAANRSAHFMSADVEELEMEETMENGVDMDSQEEPESEDDEDLETPETDLETLETDVETLETDVETLETDSTSLPAPPSQEATLPDLNQSSAENGEDLNFRRKSNTARSRRSSRPIMTGFHRVSQEFSSADKENRELTVNIPTSINHLSTDHLNLSSSTLLRCSPQVDILKSKKHPAVMLKNFRSPGLQLNSPVIVVNDAGECATSKPRKLTRFSDETNLDDEDGDDGDLDVAVLDGGQADSSAPSRPSSATSSQPSSAPSSQPSSGCSSPRADTSSASFLESLSYDPMEGPSWLFESLKKKRKRSGRGSRTKRRSKANRFSSPIFSDSPSENDGTPEKTGKQDRLTRGSIDTSKFLSTLDNRKNSLSPGDLRGSPGIFLPVDESIQDIEFNKIPRRLSLDPLDTSSYQPPEDVVQHNEVVGNRTPLREIRLESLDQVLTYNPRVDSGALVQDLREARIYLKNTRSTKSLPMKETSKRLSDFETNNLSLQPASPKSPLSFLKDKALSLTPRVDVSKAEIVRHKSATTSSNTTHLELTNSTSNRKSSNARATKVAKNSHVDLQADDAAGDVQEQGVEEEQTTTRMRRSGRSSSSRGLKRGSQHLDAQEVVEEVISLNDDKHEEEEEVEQQQPEVVDLSDDNTSESNFGSECSYAGETEDNKRSSRRRMASKTSYAEPSLRKKMRQGDPGSSSADPTFVPKLKKKAKKK